MKRLILILALLTVLAPAASASTALQARLTCARSAITGKCWCKFSYGWRPAPAIYCKVVLR